VNKEFTKTFSFTLEEALGRNISELIAAEGPWDESERLREALKRRERGDAERVRKRKDGSLLTVSFVAAPVSVNGEAAEIYGVYGDITEQKKAEEALKRSEASIS
jgi:PAS domain S-box-containing protein